ncbi:MAG: hypothetical protein RLY61_569 [Candidatus Parcubacteria bacterium]
MLSLLIETQEKIDTVINLNYLVLLESKTPWDYLAACSGRLHLIDDINEGLISRPELETLVKDTVRLMLGEPDKVLSLLNSAAYQTEIHDTLNTSVQNFKNRVTELSQLHEADIEDMQSRDTQT